MAPLKCWTTGTPNAPPDSTGNAALDCDSIAVALGELVRSGEVSSSELVEAAIARAEKVNPELNAVAIGDLDRARSKAAEASTDGVFAGVPTFFKSITNYEGLPNKFGSKAMLPVT